MTNFIELASPLRVLMIEMYKTLNITNPPFMQTYFIRIDVKYNLRSRDLLETPAEKSIMFGIDAIKCWGSLLWNSIRDLLKRASLAAIFEWKVGSWNGVECKYKICK